MRLLPKDGLERHWDWRHNTGDKRYKCGLCPYSNANSARLKKHVESKHAGTVAVPVKGE